MKRNILIAIICCVTACSLSAGDWPAYRHDSRRSGGTAEQIDAATLGRVWVWQSPVPPEPAWHGPAKWDAYHQVDAPADTRDYDKAFQISVSGGLLYVADLGIPAGVTSRIGVEPPIYGPAFVVPLEREPGQLESP